MAGIFLVTHGNYSDYTVIGYSHSKEVAEGYCALKNSEEYVNVPYCVEELQEIDIEGNVEKYYEYTMIGAWAGDKEPRNVEMVIKAGEMPLCEVKNFGYKQLYAKIYLKHEDVKKAEKIFYDMRAQFLAEREGVQ